MPAAFLIVFIIGMVIGMATPVYVPQDQIEQASFLCEKNENVKNIETSILIDDKVNCKNGARFVLKPNVPAR